MTVKFAPVLIYSLLLASPVLADQPELPLWEAGLMALNLNQSAYPGSDQLVRRNFVLPYVIYRGDVLRADRNNVGLRAFKTDTLELDMGFAASLGSSDDDIVLREGMGDLGILLEAGPRLRWTLSEDFFGIRVRADFPLRGVFDLNDSMRYSGISFEPGLNAELFTEAKTVYSFGVSALFGSEKLTDYFYQVSEEYVTTQRPFYDAQAGLIAIRGSASMSKKFSDKWRGFCFARYEWTQGAKNTDSPLLVQTGGWSFGVGFTYLWAEAARKVTD